MSEAQEHHAFFYLSDSSVDSIDAWGQIICSEHLKYGLNLETIKTFRVISMLKFLLIGRLISHVIPFWGIGR
jgi:uncharacterized membrane protein YqgA involved in biofilm formation